MKSQLNCRLFSRDSKHSKRMLLKLHKYLSFKHRNYDRGSSNHRPSARRLAITFNLTAWDIKDLDASSMFSSFGPIRTDRLLSRLQGRMYFLRTNAYNPSFITRAELRRYWKKRMSKD